jgi:hypothetical protein
MSIISHKEMKGKDNIFDIMSEEEKNIHIYTQLNTKLNEGNLDHAETLSNKCIIY